MHHSKVSQGCPFPTTTRQTSVGLGGTDSPPQPFLHSRLAGRSPKGLPSWWHPFFQLSLLLSVCSSVCSSVCLSIFWLSICLCLPLIIQMRYNTHTWIHAPTQPQNRRSYILYRSPAVHTHPTADHWHPHSWPLTSTTQLTTDTHTADHWNPPPQLTTDTHTADHQHPPHSSPLTPTQLTTGTHTADNQHPPHSWPLTPTELTTNTHTADHQHPPHSWRNNSPSAALPRCVQPCADRWGPSAASGLQWSGTPGHGACLPFPPLGTCHASPDTHTQPGMTCQQPGMTCQQPGMTCQQPAPCRTALFHILPVCARSHLMSLCACTFWTDEPSCMWISELMSLHACGYLNWWAFMHADIWTDEPLCMASSELMSLCAWRHLNSWAFVHGVIWTHEPLCMVSSELMSLCAWCHLKSWAFMYANILQPLTIPFENKTQTRLHCTLIIWCRHSF